MKKKFLILLVLCLCGCNVSQNNEDTPVDNTPVVIDLPEKDDPNSTVMSESPITPLNIDNYLFREDCLYLDTRSPKQFYMEGSIAGFINLPFYEYVADFNADVNALFTIKKIKNDDGSIIYPGDPGSFIANYEESEELIKDLIPNNKKILIIATAGVESCYLMNLLIQLGYDPANLYNVGSFTNGMGDDIAYRNYSEAKHLVEPFELYDTNIEYNWENLTPIK